MHPFADVLLPEPEHDAGAMAPAGQLWTTVEDLSRWATFAGGDTAEVLSADTLAEMYEPHTINDNPGQPWTSAHGLGCRCGTSTARGMPATAGRCPASSPACGSLDAGVPVGGATSGSAGTGGTASTPTAGAAGDGVVLFTNTTASMATRATIADLLDTLTRREPAPVEPWRASGDPSVLELVGTWHWGPSTVTAKVAGGHLVLGEPGSGRGARFGPVATDEWVGLDGTTRASRCVWCARATGLSRTSTSRRSASRAPPTTRADVPGGVDEGGWT